MADHPRDRSPSACDAGAAPGPDGWDACTWEGARRDVLERAAGMTFREKIMWLEEATLLAMRFSPARMRGESPDHTSM
jgi:hypothetical protein